MKVIKDRQFDAERSLYNESNLLLDNVIFAGDADGESALKESSDITITDCSFKLRYPLWHAKRVNIERSIMTETCRAPLWYSDDINVNNSKFDGVKTFRECRNVNINKLQMTSSEAFWFTSNIKIKESEITSEYGFLKTKNVMIDNLKFKGKYSFQYAENVEIRDSYLDTKDAFWEAKNVTVINSVVKGEYLGWYSKNLKLINCHIIGTQPLCYCEGLVMENCTMDEADFAFELSDVTASINNNIISIKNPKAGSISVEGVDEVIIDIETSCKISINNRK